MEKKKNEVSLTGTKTETTVPSSSSSPKAPTTTSVSGPVSIPPSAAPLAQPPPQQPPLTQKPPPIQQPPPLQQPPSQQPAPPLKQPSPSQQQPPPLKQTSPSQQQPPPVQQPPPSSQQQKQHPLTKTVPTDAGPLCLMSKKSENEGPTTSKSFASASSTSSPKADAASSLPKEKVGVEREMGKMSKDIASGSKSVAAASHPLAQPSPTEAIDSQTKTPTPSARDPQVTGATEGLLKYPKGMVRSSSGCVSPARILPVTVETVVEEEPEDFIAARSSRSGSAGTISTGGLVEAAVASGTRSGFPLKKRASLHHGHGKKLIRRSSFLVDTACSTHMNVLPKPQEPVPQPVVQQTRRCSLTLPYPNLYGSWQAAGAAPQPPVVKTNSHEMGTGLTHAHPPPLLKRKSVAQFDMSGNVNAAAAVPGDNIGVLGQANFRRSKGPINLQAMGPVSTVPANILAPSPEEESAETNFSENPEPVTPAPSPVGDGEGSAEVELVDEPYLLAIHLQKVPMKDFGSEVRATLDVAHFLNHAVLLLDVNESTLEGVVDAMLVRLFRVAEEPHCTVAEAKSSLFAHDSVHLLARTIQGTTGSEGISFDYDQSWICAICNLPTLQRRHVAIARLKHPANFGRTSHDVRLFILVLCPSKEKGTKNALETGRTFATIFSDVDFRLKLLESTTEDEFKGRIIKQAQDLSQLSNNMDGRLMDNQAPGPDYEYPKENFFRFGTGILEDFQRRLPHYMSDYRDGIEGYKTVNKTVSTTFFLYFACILPAIAFGVLNDHTTRGLIDVKKVIVGQTMGELFYVTLSGQPLNILLTTAPLCLFVKILYALAEDFGVDFEALYCCVGLWSSLFTALYALLDVSRLMRWSTRSTEEIFALFISIAFCVDAFRDTVKNFKDNYSAPPCKGIDLSNTSVLKHVMNGSEAEVVTAAVAWTKEAVSGNGSVPTALSLVTNTVESTICHRDSSILFLLLMLGTLWLGVSLYNFNKTPYLQASKREALADYSLPVAVVVLSFIGSFVFQDVPLERFKYDDNQVFKVAPMHKISWTAVFCSVGLGFSLSLLIFMDQNITSAMVNNPCNKLKKGPAYHWDLMIVAIINGFLSVFTMPWMHATLPHSPLHMRSLADVEERVDQGHVYEIIVRVRETRLTGIFSHLLIGLSIFLLPYPLGHIPIAVLDGLFLYMAVTALNGNQMFERITLLFMEQAAYPPNHYIRRVPQRKIHQFTGFQVLQLSIMCVVGFVPWAYVKMVFPVTLLLLLPIRHKIVPLIIEQKYLDALDGEHQ